MKIFKFLAVALVAMLGFTACDKETEYIYDDHSADLVGTWTCIQDGFAEALVIKADGSILATGLGGGNYWEDMKGNITVENGNATLSFEDGVIFEGHFDIIPGVAFSINPENEERVTFNYCANDLSKEIVGMWVCADGPANKENDMLIQIFNEDGTSVMTGDADELLVNDESTTYKVIGDLLLLQMNKESVSYVPFRMTYSPDATTLGDVMTLTLAMKNAGIKSTATWLRVKQTLDLAGKKYDYIKTFVTNVDGLDKDINFMGFEFNFAKMDGVKLDKMLKTLLFNVEFPDANTIKYSCHYNNEPMSLDAPIVVDGNKMTVKMSTKNAAYKDIDLYTFQDADCSQMHMYMPTYAFINFFGNMQATIMSQMGDLDLTDAAAVKAVFDSIDEAVNTINVSFVMTKAAN